MASTMNLSHHGRGLESGNGSMEIDNLSRLLHGMFTGGLNVLLVSQMPDKYKCPFCKKLMRDPVQTLNPPCEGDRACHACYIEAQT